MANPQQPELRRSGKVAALDPDATATDLTGHQRPGTKGRTGTVPEDQRPGHHPEDEQDKPDLDKFAERLGIVPEGEEPEDAPRVEDDTAPPRKTVTRLSDARSRKQPARPAKSAPAAKPKAKAKTPARPTWSPIGLALVGPVTGVLIAKRVLQVLTRRGR
ncbi:MAG TPA: hypothetical protein VFV42_01415 [Acidimicrobiales bacterium]|nr:hypothetical protein [Acidimicrobiales bacterium]